MDLFSPGFSLCGSVELFLLWKNFPSFSVYLFLPLHSSLTQFFCLSQFISLCTIFHVLSFLSLSLSPSQYLWSLCPSLYDLPSSLYVLRISLPQSLFIPYFLSPSPPFFRWPPLSAFLLLSSSASALPGCISSRRASPKRY